MRIKITLLITTLLLLIVGGAAQAQSERQSILHDDLERSFYVYQPESAEANSSAPLLIALHPAASSGKAMEILTGLNDLADEEGFIVVYPNASASGWGEDTSTEDENADDIGFIQALIDHMADEYSIDPEQVYLTGFAHGGQMAYRLACEMPERLQGIAIIGPLMWGYHRDNCLEMESAPINMLVMHGTADTFYAQAGYTYSTLFSGKSYPILSVIDTLRVWSERNTCELDEEPDLDTVIDLVCEDDNHVAYYPVVGGRESWFRTGDYKLNNFGIDTSQIIWNFFDGAEDWATPQPGRIVEHVRTFAAYVPDSYDATEPMPAVVLLHGRFGSGSGTAFFTEMARFAEQEGFIGIYPDGLPHANADARDTGWNYLKGASFWTTQEHDDVRFILDLLDDLSLDLNIDRSRVYVTGISNGGFMVQRLACSAPDVFAAFASVAGAGYLGMEEHCTSDTPVNMLIMHGTDDNNILWDGISQRLENGQEIYTLYPVTETVGLWASHNNCESEEAEISDLPQLGDSPETIVRVISLLGCREDTELLLYAVIGGGHNWPGIATGLPSEVAGNINLDMHATEVIWEFFSRHSLNGQID